MIDASNSREASNAQARAAKVQDQNRWVVASARANARRAEILNRTPGVAAVEAARDEALSPNGAGMAMAQTPYGTVGVSQRTSRVGAFPMPRSQAHLFAPSAASLTPQTFPRPSTALPAPVASVPQVPAPTIPRTAAQPAPAMTPQQANLNRLKEGDAVARGMFGGVNSAALPRLAQKAQQAPRTDGPVPAAGRTGMAVADRLATGAKSMWDTFRTIQKRGLITTAGRKPEWQQRGEAAQQRATSGGVNLL